MPQSSPWIELVRRIVAEVSRSDATEFELSRGSFRVLVKRQPGVGRAEILTETTIPGQAAETGAHAIVAPLTGIFYRAPAPTSPPYVEVGDLVEPHTTVGLIEAMKVFNEVAAEVRGQITAIHAQAGQLVYAGDTLMLVEVAQEPGTEPEGAK